jgi:hypothetical protein
MTSERIAAVLCMLFITISLIFFILSCCFWTEPTRWIWGSIFAGVVVITVKVRPRLID